MKFTSTVVVGALAPSLASAAALTFRWGVESPEPWDAKNPSIPDKGIQEISFPIDMTQASHMQGYSIHHMLSFKKDDGKNVDASLAVDLGPRSGGGQGQFGARFASPKGAKTSHENCRTDKDTVIFSTEVEESYQNTLQLTVRKVEGEEETWEGAVVIAGNPRVIGRWTLPKGSGNVWILGKGEVDYAGELSCAERPFNSVSIGAPTVRGSPPEALALIRAGTKNASGSFLRPSRLLSKLERWTSKK